MAFSLQVDKGLQSAAQPVKDQQGHSSALSVSTSAVGVGTAAPKDTLDVAGNVVLNGNTETQLAATGDAVTLKGDPIILDRYDAPARLDPDWIERECGVQHSAGRCESKRGLHQVWRPDRVEAAFWTDARKQPPQRAAGEYRNRWRDDDHSG